MLQTVNHSIPPVFTKDSKVLILGSIPSPKSREIGFFYGHPRNRFWHVLAEIFATEIPQTTEEKSDFLIRHQIALWDVLASCEIAGASDQSIRNPIPNPIEDILSESDIRAIFTTGKKAYELYQRYCFPLTMRKALSLFSPSPANCRISFEQICDNYRVILSYLS